MTATTLASVTARELATATGLPEPVARQITARVLSPDYQRWTEQVTRCGYCSRPVRLKGSLTSVRPDGQQVTYTTAGEPDRTLLVRCGNRRASVCPSCSAEYKGDTWHLLAAGTGGGIKGVPATVAQHPMVFATLTAPSFGPVHTVTRDPGQRCHAGARARCPHGRRVTCGRRHDLDDPVVGEPLCPDCYDYPAAVTFNWHAPELWRRFTIALRRALAATAGLSEAAFTRTCRVSFAKVAEFQRRGVVHFHAIIRLDGTNHDYAPPTLPLTADALVAAVLTAAAGVTLTVARSSTEELSLSFGAQIDVRPIRHTEHAEDVEDVEDADDAEPTPGRVAAYIAKYATKAAEDFGVGERIRSGADLDRRPLRPHVAALIDAGRRLNAVAGYDGIATWLHMLCFRGHFSTKSRRFSTTLTALRQARAHWRRETTRSPATDDDTTLIVGDWRFTGLGYLTPGDTALANAAADHAREQHEHRKLLAA